MRIIPLAETLRPLLPSSPASTLYAGPWRLGKALAEGHPLLIATPRLRHARRAGERSVVARASAPPFAHHGFRCIILAQQLRGGPEQERTILSEVSALLEAGGLLLLVEPIHGLFAPRGLRPDHLSSLLLNAGFDAIEQRWPACKAVVTSGRPGPCVAAPALTDG